MPRTLLTLEEKTENKRKSDAVYYAANRARASVYRKKHYQANKEKIQAQLKTYAEAHKETIKRYQAEYRKQNRKKLSAYTKNRRKKDPVFKLLGDCRNRLNLALKGRVKCKSTLSLLGCSIEFLKEHLEKQFQPGMTWENRGAVWHVDHILPCAEFHLQHSEEQEICFHWTNLQPLFVTDNLSKSDKII